MKLYFVRHGESEANILHVFSNTGLKHPLTQAGRAQAEKLAETLGTEHFHTIYSSPVLRAVETSRILADKFGLPVIQTEALREFDVGELEGSSAPEDWQIFADLNRAWINQQWELKLPGGENFYEIRGRFVPFVDSLINDYQDSGENILLVSHGGIFVHMLPLVMDNLPAAFAAEHYLQPTEYAIGSYTAGARTCIYWGNKEFTLPK